MKYKLISILRFLSKLIKSEHFMLPPPILIIKCNKAKVKNNERIIIMFKKKINYADVSALIYQIGYERYEFLNNEFSENHEYSQPYFFIVFQIVNCFVFQRMLKFRELVNKDYDFFKDCYKYIKQSLLNLNNEEMLDIVYEDIVHDILLIWENDNDTNSNNEIYNTASYIVESMMELNEYQDTEIMKSYLVEYLCDMHFENKNLIKDFKIIE